MVLATWSAHLARALSKICGSRKASHSSGTPFAFTSGDVAVEMSSASPTPFALQSNGAGGGFVRSWVMTTSPTSAPSISMISCSVTRRAGCSAVTCQRLPCTTRPPAPTIVIESPPPRGPNEVVVVPKPVVVVTVDELVDEVEASPVTVTSPVVGLTPQSGLLTSLSPGRRRSPFASPPMFATMSRSR